MLYLFLLLIYWFHASFTSNTIGAFKHTIPICNDNKTRGLLVVCQIRFIFFQFTELKVFENAKKKERVCIIDLKEEKVLTAIMMNFM